jgi:hypothetical protein
MLCVVVDPLAGIVAYSRAGHLPALICRADD